MNSEQKMKTSIIYSLITLLSSVAFTMAATINEKVEQLDFETADLNEVIRIFGEPIRYFWGNETFTKDNLPVGYLMEYPEGSEICMNRNRVFEVRFYPGSSYVYPRGFMVGSLLDTVISVLGEPVRTVVGEQCTFEDKVLYKDINGKAGYCFYQRSDKNVRLFFLNYCVSALYLTGNVGSGSPKPITEYQDIRSEDFSGNDFSQQLDLLRTLTFNKETIWPEPYKLPPDTGPNEIMTEAMNPGLGIRALHQQGSTGAGISVAIIDQPLVDDHPEYDGKIAEYYDTGCDGSISSMHGPAVASLFVGENCGTAPGARVYYAAAPSWKKDAAYYADALEWIIEKNNVLPNYNKIRVVSVSAAPSGPGSPFTINNQMWDNAVARAETAGILVLDCTTNHGFIGSCWLDCNDPENPASCTSGYPDSNIWPDLADILVPSSPRTTAQHYDHHGWDSYIYWGRGGLSWTIPYCSGVLAMGWQRNPQLSADEMVDLLYSSAYVNPDGAKIIDPVEFLKQVVPPTPREIAYHSVEQAILDCEDMVQQHQELFKELINACKQLRIMLKDRQYEGLTKKQILKARIKVFVAFYYCMKSKRALKKSEYLLNDAMTNLEP